MKREIRTLGVDDAPFHWTDATVPAVGVVMRGAGYVEGVLTAPVTVDGDDATQVLAALIGGSRHRRGLKAILLDGIALGGFNVVDLDALHDEVGVPVVTITREPPDRDAMAAALRKHHADWERRLALIDKYWPRPMQAPHGEVHAHAVGLTREEVAQVLERVTVRGLVPEPIRLAHLIASAMARGESTGPA